MQVVKEENDEDEGGSQRDHSEETNERASEARSDDEGECDEQVRVTSSFYLFVRNHG